MKYEDPYLLIKTLKSEQNLTNEMLSKKLNLSYTETKDLLRADIPITEKIAEKLEECFGISYFEWIRLENLYRQSQQKWFLVGTSVAAITVFVLIYILHKIYAPLFENKIIIVTFIIYYIFLIFDFIDNGLKLKNLKEELQ